MKSYYDDQKGMCIEGNFWLVHPQTGEPWNKDSVAQFIDVKAAENKDDSELEAIQQLVIARIKQLAFNKLQSELWRVERAKEHELGHRLSGNEEAAVQARESLQAILQQREAVRIKSDELEKQVLSLSCEADLLNFVIEF
ncbi:hypothetical protein [Pseudoalteromonas piscicida]|uniref:hypothetical protein n=1 Tax=Pseudoalteromonas piscicida TaxID=43662 RepID=UPI0030B2CDAB